MEKFIKFYVTDTDETQGYRLVNCDGIIQVIQASTTTVTITYRNTVAANDVLTITTDAIAANAITMRQYVEDAIEEALRTSWQKPFYTADSILPPSAADPLVAITITAIALA